MDSVGDGFCDDFTNVIECNYDGGDCCMGIKGFFCIQCVCKDTYTGYPVLTTEPFNWQGNITIKKFNYEIFWNSFGISDEACAVEDSKIGDGVCDPEAAFLYSCDYDAGDCSGTGFKS